MIHLYNIYSILPTTPIFWMDKTIYICINVCTSTFGTAHQYSTWVGGGNLYHLKPTESRQKYQCVETMSYYHGAK